MQTSCYVECGLRYRNSMLMFVLEGERSPDLGAFTGGAAQRGTDGGVARCWEGKSWKESLLAGERQAVAQRLGLVLDQVPGNAAFLLEQRLLKG